MNIKTSLTGQKLAILIGSQSRAIKDTYMNINFFLSLFDIPYDVFICSDEADLDNFKLIKNIHSTISLEEVESKNKWLLNNKEAMHKHYWQNAKLYGVSSLFKPHLSEYSHALKIRTDFMFDYEGFFKDFGIPIKNMSLEHLNFIRRHLQICLHHCSFKEVRPFKDLFIDDAHQKKVMPLLWNGDRFWFGAAGSVLSYSTQTMVIANKIKQIYSHYEPLPLHPDFKVISNQLSTLPLPKFIFPNGLPETAIEIAETMNKNASKIKSIGSLSKSESIPPLIQSGVPYAGHDVFLQGSFNADILAFITQAYIPYIKPMKYGFIKHMHFTRYENNIKMTKDRLQIRQAFHKNDQSYKNSINFQNQLIKLKNADIPQT